jgi:hypothetical protein
MSKYKAVKTCLFEGIMLRANQELFVPAKLERRHKLGEFVESRPDERALRRDPNSKKKIKIGFEHLLKIDDSRLPEEGKESSDWIRIPGFPGFLVGPEPPKFEWERNLRGPAPAGV